MRNETLAYESGLLGVLVGTGDGFGHVSHLLTAADFQNADYAALFAVVCACVAEGRPYDAMTIESRHVPLGGLAVDLATNAAWSPKNLCYYAEQIAKAATTRRLRAVGATIARSDDMTYDDAARLIATCAPRDLGSVVTLADVVRDVLVDVQTRMDAPGLPGITTGLGELDRLTGGWQPGDLIIVAARPSVGKTALAEQLALSGAKAGHHCLFFTLEMPPSRIAARLLAHEAHVDVSGFRTPGDFSDADHARLYDASATLAALPFDLVRGTGQTVESISAIARQRHAAAPLGLVVVDYLTLVTPPKAATVNDGVQLMTRALKRLAVELHVPVLLLSQLNRAAASDVPTLAHLRDSGAIEQDADVVLLMHETDNGVVLNIAKHRNGECRRLGLRADMAHMRFTEAPLHEIQPDKTAAALPSFGKPAGLSGATAAAYRAEDERR